MQSDVTTQTDVIATLYGSPDEYKRHQRRLKRQRRKRTTRQAH